MKKHKGGFAALLVAIIALAALAGTALLSVEAFKKHSLEKGLAALAAGDLRTAVEKFEKAAKFSFRPNAFILLNLAKAQYALGDVNKATENLQKAESADPADADIRYELGRIYIREKNYGDAKKEISALEALHTDKADRYAQELREAAQTGTVKDAVGDFLKKILPEGIPGILKNVLPGGGGNE
ncbi:MAG: tetratricopeptide repeat protein [Synergistes sp.]|nr:tetratricopeptide repeat protein [Synergistes sp.]MCR5335627.1 tetratricopeptide repeat protein [Synergistes sp.]